MRRTHITDEELIEWYWKGWNDCGSAYGHSGFPEGILQVAYNTGWSDFIIGDDVPSYDYKRTEEIILKEIHETYNSKHEEDPS